MLRGLAGDAEPGADLGPGVAAAEQSLDCPGYRGVDLVREIGHQDQGLDVAIADPASVGTQDAGASLMLAQGTPLHVVSEVLGHASIAITKDVYGHLLEGDKRRRLSR